MTATERAMVQSHRFVSWFRLGVIITSALLVAACSTTGDPNADSIFWSEKKAQARLDSANRLVEESQQEEARLREEGARLRQAESRVLEQRDHLQLQFSILRSETRRLEEQIRDASPPNDQEVAELRETLASLRRTIDDLEKSSKLGEHRSASTVTAIKQQIAEARTRVDLLLHTAGP